jgi:hypothetical protein
MVEGLIDSGCMLLLNVRARPELVATPTSFAVGYVAMTTGGRRFSRTKRETTSRQPSSPNPSKTEKMIRGTVPCRYKNYLLVLMGPADEVYVLSENVLSEKLIADF